VRPAAPGPSSYFTIKEGLLPEHDPLLKTQVQLDKYRHAVPSSLLSSTYPSLRSESATSSDVVPPPSSGPSEGRPNSIRARVRTCDPDSASAVQPTPLDFEAFLRDSINLDIISGRSLSQIFLSVSNGEENQGVTIHVVPAIGRSREVSGRVHS